ncbi:hypothetical protein [Halomicrobium katesii]|uniref:hypothetical protein n=1 Tax=Halomicrobium katesii TaxID=437163 RepID=UPI000477DF0A
MFVGLVNNVSTEELTVETGGDAERTLGPAALASIASVALALYYYYVRGDKQRGQFVGLWPATILGLAIYRRLGEIETELERHRD